MKHTLTALAIAFTMSATAQTAPPVDLHLAGTHLEKAGKQRNTALLVGLTTAAIGGMILAVDPEMVGPAAGMAVTGLTVGLVLNIGANGHEKRAGRILQRKP
jgi:hypothetical protein